MNAYSVPLYNVIFFLLKICCCCCINLDRLGDEAITNSLNILVAYHNKGLFFTQAMWSSHIGSCLPPYLTLELTLKIQSPS